VNTPGINWDLAAAFQHMPKLLDEMRPLVSPHNEPVHIVNKARAVLDGWSEGDKIALLNSHPRIGAPADSLSGPSLREQSGHTDVETLAELGRLNDAYEAHFGFRFVVFVNGRLNSMILPVLRRRLQHSRDDELATAIEEYLAITRLRLEQQTQ
jgi:2-oxo-4-hydroxy-4-carboxy--5-ureidoimidazoline (OHCU) decarboxylase